MSEGLFEQLDFEPNARFEKIISDLTDHSFSVVPDFLSQAETDALRNVLLRKFEEDAFKKAAIGNRFNEVMMKSVRGDFISWIDFNPAEGPKAHFGSRIDALIAYLNRTCFLGIAGKEFHYAIYPDGTRYQRELEHEVRPATRRRLSLTGWLKTR